MLITISGASGVGKDTIARFLLSILPRARFLRSFTTRESRNEDLGYEYVSEEVFSDMERKGKFAWTDGSHGNRYGTLKSDFIKIGIDDECIYISALTPDKVAQARLLARRFRAGEVLSIYLYCSDTNILRGRLIKRDEKDVNRRINDCIHWNLTAKQLPFFVWVDNSGDLGITKRKVALLVKEAGFLDLE